MYNGNHSHGAQRSILFIELFIRWVMWMQRAQSRSLRPDISVTGEMHTKAKWELTIHLNLVTGEQWQLMSLFTSPVAFLYKPSNETMFCFFFFLSASRSLSADVWCHSFPSITLLNPTLCPTLSVCSSTCSCVTRFCWQFHSGHIL